MIDLALLREQPEKIADLIRKKDPSYDTVHLIQLDEETRSLMNRVESLRHKKNELAQQAKSGITEEIRSQSISIGKELKEIEGEFKEKEEALKELLLRCPNIPEETLPIGGKEANKVIRSWGKPPTFNFEPKNHLELGTALGFFDLEAPAQFTGAGFILYKEAGVKLISALVEMMLRNNAEHGFNYMYPPTLVNGKSLEIASNFPKFKEEVYSVRDEDLYLIPTAEVPLANLYRNRIFDAQELPKRFTAATSCFRREAGGYGAQERGLIRIHQFEKVELFTYCLPEDSEAELDRMVACAESLLQKLGLAYQITLLATQDCSFPSAKTYDIEVYIPGLGYKEVSSCSKCTDFQARRGGVRFKRHQGDKTSLVHTLNASSLALPRLIVALLETYQKADGSVELPPVLKQYGLY